MPEPFSAEFGPYVIVLPGGASLEAIADRPAPGAYQRVFTRWIVGLGRFQLFVHLDARHGLSGLKDFIDYETKGDVTVEEVTANGLPGVSHGDYGPRTWIDWWFKKGDTMICICLQSVAFPMTVPTEAERAEHRQIMGSLKYIPDNPDLGFSAT